MVNGHAGFMWYLISEHHRARRWLPEVDYVPLETGTPRCGIDRLSDRLGSAHAMQHSFMIFWLQSKGASKLLKVEVC